MAEGKKGRKVGRNKTTALAYKSSQRREFNKARRIKRHLKHHPNNQTAWERLAQLSDTVLYQAQKSTLGLVEFLKQRPSAA